MALVSRFRSMLMAVSRPATDTTRGSANGFSPSLIACRSSAESESIVTKTSAFRSDVNVTAWACFLPALRCRTQVNRTDGSR